MITNALIALALAIVGGILSIFPDSSGLPPQVDDAVAYIGGYAGILDPLVPLATMATIISLLITVELSIFAFKGLRWIFSYVPMVGGKG